jgi:hypothetical protein
MSGPRSGAPPGKETGPPRSEPAPNLDTTTARPKASVASTITDPASLAGKSARNPSPHRVRDLGRYRRLRCIRELDQLLDEMHPPKPPEPPSTFGLTEDELRRHANRLVRDYGWSTEEVLAVLDVQLRAMP